MYCHKCGAEIGKDSKVCPYCGVSVQKTDVQDEKDKKIEAMEKKIQKLEATIAQSSREEPKSEDNNMPVSPWFIFGLPLCFVVIFFTFIIILVRTV